MAATNASQLQRSITDMAVRAQERRARRLLLQGNLDGAIAVYREIAVLDPDNANAHYQLGLCYRQRRQWAEATAALQRADTLGDERAAPLLHAEGAPRAEPNLNEEETAPVPAVIVGGQVITLGAPEAEAPNRGDTARQRGEADAAVLADAAPTADAAVLADAATPASSAGSTRVAEPPPIYMPRGAPVRPDESEEQAAHRPIVCPPLDDVFAMGGPLAASLGPRYRPRPGQVRMASLIREALQGRRHAVIEAGTGIGKSFAYLIPVIWSDTPAVVSTSNKALMNQLWDKDIPRLQEIAPRPFKAALLKGRGNYLCRLRLDQLRERVDRPEREHDLALIHKALQQVPDGDLERMALPPTLTAHLRVSNRACKGRRCPHFTTCLYERAKQRAAEADVVVTNHAMLCHNALLAGNYILPVRPVLIIDEAHQLTRYAIEALTMALEHEQFWGLLNGPTVRAAVADANHLGEIQAAYDDLYRAVARQRPDGGRANHRPTRWALTGELQAALALSDTLRQLQHTVSTARDLDEADQENALLQLAQLAETSQALARPEPPSHIRLAEMTETGAAAGATATAAASAYLASYRPLEVAGTLREMLFDAWPRVICTSATLSVADDLGWYRRQVGLFASLDAKTEDNGTSVIAEMLASPFDYPRQVLLYTPRALTPVYNERRRAFAQSYVQDLTAEVLRLLEASRGRALVLCTSRARMHQLHATLAPDLQERYPCYLQGEHAQPELVRRFQRDGNAVLFATRGFWEGLDIPGDALAMVILDKIPFVPYDDPIMRKQETQVRARGGNTFYDLQLGPAILNLRQGAGRLIRSETDRGVIALLDGRVLRKAYGRQIIQSLPEGCHTTDFDDVAAFLRRK